MKDKRFRHPYAVEALLDAVNSDLFPERYESEQQHSLIRGDVAEELEANHWHPDGCPKGNLVDAALGAVADEGRHKADHPPET
jgi:hypothetical protein